MITKLQNRFSIIYFFKQFGDIRTTVILFRVTYNLWNKCILGTALDIKGYKFYPNNICISNL